MPTMKDLYGKSRVQKAQPLTPKEIGHSVEIEATLYAAPRQLRASEGMSRSQFRGWLDEAGTVRARAYVPGSPAAHAGEVIAFTNEDDGFICEPDERNEGLAKVEYTQADGTLVIVWLPEDADVRKYRVVLGIG